MDSLFEIEALSCSYNNQDVVLEIPKLNLKRGKIYFFLGPSGIGKSTLLEVLGVMNYPVKGNPSKLNYYLPNGNCINLHGLWQDGDEQLSKFRMSEFSFVFQQTNLMPYFTAGENMAYTLLLEGKSWQEAKSRVLEVMNMFDLPDQLFDRSIQQMSGGQRQRLAFVRAFVSKFNVIFCDEPTGNLDKKNSWLLMQALREFIKLQSKTAVIVTHDMSLAIEFADLIFCLDKCESGDHNKDFGLLKSDNFYEKTDGQWIKDGKKVNTTIKQQLESIL